MPPPRKSASKAAPGPPFRFGSCRQQEQRVPAPPGDRRPDNSVRRVEREPSDASRPCYYVATQISGLNDPERHPPDTRPEQRWPNGLSWTGWTIGAALRIRRLGVRIPPSAPEFAVQGIDIGPLGRWRRSADSVASHQPANTKRCGVTSKYSSVELAQTDSVDGWNLIVDEIPSKVSRPRPLKEAG
jgi:hypothetical protein